MTHKGTVTLETERLILRRFTIDDAEPMFRNWCTDPDVTKYLMWPPHSSIEVTRQTLYDIWLSRYDGLDFYQWAIELKDIHEPIGSIGIMKQDDKTRMVHFGYCLGRAWWHKGFMSEALCRLVRFFFEEVGVNRIESRHDPRNPNSGKVMQKAGLRYEGTFRQSDWNNQGVCDAAHYAILAEDYFGKRKRESAVIPNKMINKITPLEREKWQGYVLPFHYVSHNYYDVDITRSGNNFNVSFIKKPFDAPFEYIPEKDYDKLFQPHWEQVKAWGIIENECLIAAVETAVEEWSNRLRVTELWIDDAYRRQGIGRLLMDIAVGRAREEKRRAIMLETQSRNENAIAFYLAYGFTLIGFNACEYQNDDIERKEVRMEMGMLL